MKRHRDAWTIDAAIGRAEVTDNHLKRMAGGPERSRVHAQESSPTPPTPSRLALLSATTLPRPARPRALCRRLAIRLRRVRHPPRGPRRRSSHAWPSLHEWSASRCVPPAPAPAFSDRLDPPRSSARDPATMDRIGEQPYPGPRPARRPPPIRRVSLPMSSIVPDEDVAASQDASSSFQPPPRNLYSGCRDGSAAKDVSDGAQAIWLARGPGSPNCGRRSGVERSCRCPSRRARPGRISSSFGSNSCVGSSVATSS